LSDFTLLQRRKRELFEQLLLAEEQMLTAASQLSLEVSLESVKDTVTRTAPPAQMMRRRNKASRRNINKRDRRDAAGTAGNTSSVESKGDVDVDAPMAAMGSFTNKPANIAPPSFAIGDQVDGLCVLPNGSKRWFPGIIISADSNHSIETYAVQFNDGDVNRSMGSSSLRHRKKRVRRLSQSNHAGDDCSMSMMSSNDEVSCISSLDNFSVTGSLTGEYTEHIVDLYPNNSSTTHFYNEEAPASSSSSRSLGSNSISSVQDSRHPKNNDIDEIVMDSFIVAPQGTKRSSLSRGFNEDFQAFLNSDKSIEGQGQSRSEQASPYFTLSPSFHNCEDPVESRDAMSVGLKELDDNDDDDHAISVGLKDLDDDDDDVVSAASSMHSVKSGPDEIQRALSDTSSEGDRIFEIPSVFEGIHRSNAGSAALNQSREGTTRLGITHHG